MTLKEKLLLEDKFNDFTINLEKYTDKAKDLVSIFKQNKNKIKEIEKRDIQYWEKQKPQAFVDFVNNLSQVKSNTQQKVEQKTSGAEIIYEDDEWLVYHIKTEEASKLLGKGTKWCVSATTSNYFYYYMNEGATFYFFISKTLSQIDENYKIAAVVYPGGTIDYFDAIDNKIDRPDILPNIELKALAPEFKIEGKVLTKVNNKSLAEFIIPNEIEVIGEEAFYNCKSLASIIIPDSVKEIESYAFDECYSLVSVVIPDSVKQIDAGAFSDCRSLTSAKLPKSLEELDTDIFYKCISLTSIDIPNTVKIIKDYAFAWCESLTSITIPKQVEEVMRFAFKGCKNLKKVKLLNPNCKIHTLAFDACPNVKIEKQN